MRLFQSHGTGIDSAVNLLLLIIATVGSGDGEVSCGVPAAKTIEADVTQVPIIAAAHSSVGHCGLLFLIAAALGVRN